MKNITIVLLFILTLSNLNKIFSWDPETAKYFPLQTGNTWVYNGSSSGPGFGIWIDRYKITGTIVSGAKMYYVINHTRRLISGSNLCEIRVFAGDFAMRIDSTTMNLYKLQPCNPFSETLIDSLKAKKNDSSNTCNALGNKSKCTDTSVTNIFSLSKSSKTFTVNYFEGQENEKYVKDIGISYFTHGLSMYNCMFNLKGCIINNMVFGDTSIITGLNIISNEVPEHYSLDQNYPNPFNPETRINFGIPKISMTKIVIYDFLGREIVVLLDKEIGAGMYSIDWNAGSYTSGIYFLSITSGDFTASRKMVLIK